MKNKTNLTILILSIVAVSTLTIITFPQWGSKVFNSAPTAINASPGSHDSDIVEEEEEDACGDLDS